MKPRSIELHIGELVLEGFEPGRRHLVGAAIERELGRALAEQGVPARLTQAGEASHLDAGAFELTPGSGEGTLGRQVAGVVYSALQQ